LCQKPSRLSHSNGPPPHPPHGGKLLCFSGPRRGVFVFVFFFREFFSAADGPGARPGGSSEERRGAPRARVPPPLFEKTSIGTGNAAPLLEGCDPEISEKIASTVIKRPPEGPSDPGGAARASWPPFGQNTESNYETHNRAFGNLLNIRDARVFFKTGQMSKGPYVAPRGSPRCRYLVPPIAEIAEGGGVRDIQWLMASRSPKSFAGGPNARPNGTDLWLLPIGWAPREPAQAAALKRLAGKSGNQGRRQIGRNSTPPRFSIPQLALPTKRVETQTTLPVPTRNFCSVGLVLRSTAGGGRTPNWAPACVCGRRSALDCRARPGRISLGICFPAGS